jgi:acyl-CoA thioesterase-1
LRPGVVMIELGGNDALRGLPLANTRDNLLAMTQQAQEAGAKVLMLGMQVPPNYGASYGREFAAMFEQVAKERKAALVPFFLQGVADRADANDWFQPDRIHPLAKAHPLMLEQVWPVLRGLL